MSLILIIIVLLLLFGGGGGYYGYRSGWYGSPTTGFHPMSIVWIILVILLIFWLISELGVIRIGR